MFSVYPRCRQRLSMALSAMEQRLQTREAEFAAAQHRMATTADFDLHVRACHHVMLTLAVAATGHTHLLSRLSCLCEQQMKAKYERLLREKDQQMDSMRAEVRPPVLFALVLAPVEHCHN